MTKKILKTFRTMLLLIMVSMLVVYCSNGGSSGGGTPVNLTANLVVDNISAIPIINGESVTYGVYIENIGSAGVSGLSFSVTENSSIDINPLIDASNCSNIAASSSCKINITTASIGSFKITGSINGSPVISFVTSTYPLTTPGSGDAQDLRNALILSYYPTTLVLKRKTSDELSNRSYFGAVNIAVVNIYNGPIDVTNLFDTLPNNVSWSPINCPNPLPFGVVCQVRLSYNGDIGNNITVNLNLSGKIISSGTVLPPQNSSGAIVITKGVIANLSISSSSLILNANNPTTNNTTTVFITNIGTAIATVNGITITDNLDNGFSIGNNQCTGQLAVNSTCQFTIIADVSKLSNIASGNNYGNDIIVTYNNGKTTTQSSGKLTYQYTALIPITPIPEVQPRLQLNGVIPTNFYGDEVQTIPLILTNSSTATNGGDATLTVDMNNLTMNLGTNLSGTLDTNGITAISPCSVTTGSMILNVNESCGVNLKLTANIPSATSVLLTITPSYQYYTYSSHESQSGILTPASDIQIQDLSGVMIIQERSASLNLDYFTDTSYSTSVTSLSTEQGLIVPSAVLRVTNTGTTSLTGIMLPTITGFTFTPESNCNTLAIGSSCNVMITLNTENVINQANLNTNLINYTYNYFGSQSGSTNLPSLSYQVTAADTPIISSIISMDNCGTGSTAQLCYLNPSSSGTASGLASAYQFVLTYKNTGSANAVFTAIPITLDNHAVVNNCESVSLVAGTGSCTVVYKLISPENGWGSTMSQGISLATYNYTYGSQNQLNGNGSTSNPKTFSVNVSNPILNLSLESSIVSAGESTMVTAIISNWYIDSNPTATITVTDSNGTTISNSTCNNNVCTAIITGGYLEGDVSVKATMTASDGVTLIDSPIQIFKIVPSWQIVGNAGFSVNAATYTKIALDASGTPYVAYVDAGNNNKATVMKFNGTTWVNVGSAGFSADSVNFISIALDASGTPYISYMEKGNSNEKARVMKYTGTSSTGWVNVGDFVSSGGSRYTSLVFNDSGTPYIAYRDVGSNYRATVRKYNGNSNSWNNVGNVGFSDSYATYTSLALDANGTPYVAYQDESTTTPINPKGVTVKKYNGSSWDNVGNVRFSAGIASYTSLALDVNGTPYVAYQDGGNGNKATVMKFNGSSWVSVGTAGFSAGAADYTSLVLDASGTPYIAYVDEGNSNKITVMKFNGSSWVSVGTVGFSAGAANYTSLALDVSGKPYVVYSDGANSNKITVMNFK